MSMSRRCRRVSLCRYLSVVPELILRAEPLPDPEKFERREGEPEKHAARRKNADYQAQYNAVTCVALYMLLMSFCQKGIDKLRNWHEHMQMRDPDGEYEVSEGFDEGEFVLYCWSGCETLTAIAALTWFKEIFYKCHERCSACKAWLTSEHTESIWIETLVYEHALQLVRTPNRARSLSEPSPVP